MAELRLDLRNWTAEFLLGVFQTHWHIGFHHSHLRAAAGREAEVLGAWLLQRKAPRRRCGTAGRVCPEGVGDHRGKGDQGLPRGSKLS